MSKKATGEVVASSQFGTACVEFVAKRNGKFWYIEITNQSGNFGLEGMDLLYSLNGRRFKYLDSILDYLRLKKYRIYSDVLENRTYTHIHDLGFDIYID